MAHEKAIREARKALELGYSEKDATKLLRARGLDRDEIKKELPHIQKKSSLWLWLFILALIVLIVYLFYAGLLSTEMLNIKNFK